MMLKCRNTICIFGKYMQNNLPVMLGPIDYPGNTSQSIRTIKKHWDPKFKRLRAQKVIKVELPDFEENSEDFGDISPEKVRRKYRMFGLLPENQYSERLTYISCTPGIFESYIAPEGDGNFSMIKQGAKQNYKTLEMKGKSYLAIRKIKSFCQDFSVSYFVEHALDVYKKAHQSLADRDKDKLIEYVTETAYPLMTHNIMNKTIHWKFLGSLEPARVVHARCTSILSESNVFAQVTVRFHTQQMLCIYDRFGRPLQGSEILSKDVLEYIVFERHLGNEYGAWRLHGKIIPSWMPVTNVSEHTYVKPEEPKVVESKSVS